MHDKVKRILIYKNNVFILEDNVFEPKYDSFFLEENIILKNGECALDITTGVGFHAIMMADKANKVIGVDINPNAVKCAITNTIINRVEDKVEIRLGNLFEAVKSEEKFDLIVVSPPQMPTPPSKRRNDWYGISNFGGRDGRKILDKIIENAKNFLEEGGRLQILHPHYSNIPKSIKMLESLGFEVEITAEKYFPAGILSFERADYLVEIGFPLIEKDGKLMQRFVVITAYWEGENVE